MIVRPRIPEDDAAIVALINRQEADSVPLTLERYRDEATPERSVALHHGRIVGHAALDHAWWTGKPDAYAADIRVDGPERCRGIGGRLYDRLLDRAGALGITTLLGWVRLDLPEALAFVRDRGFRETAEVIEEYVLDLSRARLDGCERAERQLLEGDIRVARLAELPVDEAFLRQLQKVWMDSGALPPDAERAAARFETWKREVLAAPGLSPEWHWVALDHGRPVGMTFLKRLSADAAENDYTGVSRAYRRRGIARVLKARATRWAQENGFRYFYTSSVIGNDPMIALNRELGYEPGARRVQVERNLERSE